jgi:hypothetical protein
MESISLASVMQQLVIDVLACGVWQYLASTAVPFVTCRLVPTVARMVERIKFPTSIRFEFLIKFHVNFG